VGLHAAYSSADRGAGDVQNCTRDWSGGCLSAMDSIKNETLPQVPAWTGLANPEGALETINEFRLGLAGTRAGLGSTIFPIPSTFHVEHRTPRLKYSCLLLP
jgi:hypothetical protein